jgi:hypothetical protein
MILSIQLLGNFGPKNPCHINPYITLHKSHSTFSLAFIMSGRAGGLYGGIQFSSGAVYQSSLPKHENATSTITDPEKLDLTPPTTTMTTNTATITASAAPTVTTGESGKPTAGISSSATRYIP